MQAMEIEADVTPNGQIHLPASLRSIYGRHARLILLLEETPAKTNHAPLERWRALRGVLQNDPDFDAAMQDMENAWQTWTP